MNMRVELKTDLNVSKLIQVGGSLGVVLPKGSLRFADWKKGDLLDVHYIGEHNAFVIKNLTKDLPSMRKVEEILEEK